MYIPKYFKVENVDEILDFVQKNSFGTIVTTEQGKPIATHLPLGFNKKGDDYYITGHVSFGNPQWRTFETCQDVLVMFQGPHAYISSSWYGHEDVPTWNYQAVHIYGQASILERDELIEELTIMMGKYEKHRENPILWDNLSPQLLERQLKAIVGFKIKVEDIQAAYKLSQNRNDTDYMNIIDQLQNEGDPHAEQLAAVMKKRLEN
ncbi:MULTISPECIES: FMN-binding negative transcriptional regulator [Bacillus]|uniref:Protease synthase and sporulation negative regulatory protein PAI 2 n=3 Tax=Bacillus subtilis group TaxID=653685 RepID=A0A7Z1B300_9BACI|nr:MULTISPECIES: FMN-binding negative transcriptional regulator [Bacillus]MBC8623102.1 FMN-binding negative transcriptional regulator [Robertmurraya crescens]AJO16742.1 transcriptional regulator [Bacillus paralicheniformis]KFM90166.1 protease synthase and sporulation protein PAI 2 [Bacillus paralicheniformis]MBL7477772.1 FMN-binding negative transcriptional regulator [Bacillus paralicheniformis]MBU5329705.1 FMN-binding negative transcriptional regulator [Bacillus paralicheniformis]